MKRLSIIVPIYNVEPYVERCLRSLEDQDIPKNDYEIICINDGSPDKSREVVIRMQEEFDNITLIDQNNEGVGAARNKGIDSATGKYLMMVDSDDYLKPNSLKDRLDLIEYSNLDVGPAGYTILDKALKEEYTYDPKYNQKDILTGIDYYYKYKHGKSEIRDPHGSWAIFFKTSFLKSNNLKYLVGVPMLEDREFIARVLCLAKRVVFIDDPLYMRTTTPGSATNSRLRYSEQAINGFLKSAYHLLKFKLEYCKEEEQKTYMNQPIVHFVILYITSFNGMKFFRYYPKLYKALKKGTLRKLETTGCSKYYKKMGNYYNHSLYCFYFNQLFFRLCKSVKIRYRRIYANLILGFI